MTPFQRKFTNGYWLIALILRHFFTLECCLRTWLERTLIYSSKNHELCIPFGQNFNLKLLIALFFRELLLCRCILNLLLLNSYSILAADFCKNFLTKAYSQSLERPYRETTIGGFCYLFFGEGTPAGGGGDQHTISFSVMHIYLSESIIFMFCAHMHAYVLYHVQ